tara:strand:- start:998 stop:1153 length:156 start_codon:yes stop_codon:yes gene_type:complete
MRLLGWEEKAPQYQYLRRRLSELGDKEYSPDPDVKDPGHDHAKDFQTALSS